MPRPNLLADPPGALGPRLSLRMAAGQKVQRHPDARYDLPLDQEQYRRWLKALAALFLVVWVPMVLVIGSSLLAAH